MQTLAPPALSRSSPTPAASSRSPAAPRRLSRGRCVPTVSTRSNSHTSGKSIRHC
uniref:Uncharacterized protein n=1 Tax=Zea mays TaxID=4577 RepID=C4J863_MAIZE|nr:unknown [Zea mays]